MSREQLERPAGKVLVLDGVVERFGTVTAVDGVAGPAALAAAALVGAIWLLRRAAGRLGLGRSSSHRANHYRGVECEESSRSISARGGSHLLEPPAPEVGSLGSQKVVGRRTRPGSPAVAGAEFLCRWSGGP